MMSVAYGCLIWVVWFGGMKVICDLDRPDWRLESKEQIAYTIWGGISAVIILHMTELEYREKWLLSLLAGSLLLATITDEKSCLVYRFTWWIGGAAGGGMVLGRLVGLETIDLTGVMELCVFLGLQELFFAKFYGKADCHAFVVCALAEYGIGMGIREYLMHMLWAFGGLAIVQFLRRNVNRKGNLKQPVAFVPYINLAFWINLCCFSFGKMVER